MLSKEEDLMLMAQQSTIYDIIKNFLKTDLAIQGKITGIDVRIEEGYVNASWKFGERNKDDIIE